MLNDFMRTQRELFPKRLPVYYDAEFTGLRQDTTFISIGFISNTGSKFYAEFTDYDKSMVTPWIEENVITKLKYGSETIESYKKMPSPDREGNNFLYDIDMCGPSAMIRSSLLEWLRDQLKWSQKLKPVDKVQIFTDCYAYDWVLLMNLLTDSGNWNHPEVLDYIPMDLSTYLWVCKIDPDISREDLMSTIQRPLPDSDSWIMERKHNALWDAYVIQQCFHGLDELKLAQYLCMPKS